MPSRTDRASFTITATLGVLLGLFSGLQLTLDRIAPDSWGHLSAPTVAPLFVMVPFFLLGSSWVGLVFALFLLAPIAYWLWQPRLFKGAVTVPRRTSWLLAVLSVLSALYFAVSWHYAVLYQGRNAALWLLGANVVALLLLWWCWRSARASASFMVNALFHWFLFAWLFLLAFPWLGEAP
jgi:hypothetical protein